MHATFTEPGSQARVFETEALLRHRVRELSIAVGGWRLAFWIVEYNALQILWNFAGLFIVSR
jgi:hypothetical protein